MNTSTSFPLPINLPTLTANEPSWLTLLRHQALECFKERGFPTTRQEDWKYTKLNAMTQHQYQLPVATPVAAVAATDLSIPDLDSYTLLFVDGQFQPSLSDLAQLPSGVICCSLTEAMTQHPSLLEQHLGQLADVNKHSFQALNTAYMQSGYFCYLPDNKVLDKPIRVVFLATEQPTLSTYQLRNLIIAAKHSSATIIEHYQGQTSQSYWTNTMTEIHLAAQAQLEHYKIQQESDCAYHIGHLNVAQQAHSEFSSHSFALGGRLVRSDTQVQQVAEYAQSTLNGLYLAYGKQHIDHHTYIEHAQSHGTSRELYKGIIAEQGRAVFNGKVVVQQDAQKINAAQTNKNLLLSAQAEIDTKPELEIYADDVRCAHGATVAQLDAVQLFYLRSRGLDEQSAQNLITFAFAAELIEAVKPQSLQAYLRRAVLNKLGQDQALVEISV